MQEPRTSADLAPANRPALRRRAKRGFIAGYIHEISGRHQHVAATRTARPTSGDAIAPAPGAQTREPSTA